MKSQIKRLRAALQKTLEPEENTPKTFKPIPPKIKEPQIQLDPSEPKSPINTPLQKQSIDKYKQETKQESEIEGRRKQEWNAYRSQFPTEDVGADIPDPATRNPVSGIGSPGSYRVPNLPMTQNEFNRQFYEKEKIRSNTSQSSKPSKIEPPGKQIQPEEVPNFSIWTNYLDTVCESTNSKLLLEAVRNGEDALFALHDSLLDEGKPEVAEKLD